MKKIYDPARKLYQPAITEEMVVSEITERLTYAGARVFRAIERVPKCYRCGCWFGSSERGTPDLSGYFWKDGKEGLCFWLEVKRRKGKRREAQVERIALLKADGRCAEIVESWQDVRVCFAAFGIELPQ